MGQAQASSVSVQPTGVYVVKMALELSVSKVPHVTVPFNLPYTVLICETGLTGRLVSSIESSPLFRNLGGVKVRNFNIYIGSNMKSEHSVTRKTFKPIQILTY